MAAAVAAAAQGAAVVVLEAAERLGGTTATSGGAIWVPANPWAAAAGVEDDAESALRYLDALALGDADRPLAEAYVRRAAGVVRAIEQRTALRFEHQPGWPDYHVELGGARERSLEIGPVQVAPEALATVRPDPYGVPPLTVNEERSASPPDAAELERRRHEG